MKTKINSPLYIYYNKAGTTKSNFKYHKILKSNFNINRDFPQRDKAETQEKSR